MSTWKSESDHSRKFVRHPSVVPINIAVDEPDDSSGPEPIRSINVSEGGLAFRLLHPVSQGSQITISMPEVWPDYYASGRVAWCREAASGFEAGVEFSETNEAFKARMVAQYCMIEDYRKDVLEEEGRELSSEEAAREWILHHAARFAETLDLS